MRPGIAAVLLLLVAACNGEIYVRDGVTDGDTFYISPYAAGNPDPVVQSWIRYSLARSVCQLQIDSGNPARASSFDCERRARTHLLEAWAEETLEDAALRDPYLDDLRFVRNSGFLDEYVAHHFAKSGWALPDDLDMNAYHRWRRSELRGHDAETRIIGSWVYRNPTAAY
jgi:hypothetical protein